ncbi:hypothetical protein Cgig2_025911 [Carnegiea gigantea]|uniref:DUF4283 domain-containing protein n=1 Tax=Carnegiea gigantea TaxID=171969 RepID=A0A9Q1K5W5_9CARY|nr:hypothetical protein Cgig2_025911 [Carnegiea gigantea]
MSLEGQFPEYIEFANEKGILLRQKVIYEWLPIKCDQCKMFGHTQEQCKKQEKQKKEWRVKATTSTSRAALQEVGTTNEAETRDEEGFQPVTRHRQIMPRREELLDPMKLTNTYNVLMEGEAPQDMVGKKGGGGMNAPNKQADIKVFLQQENAGIVGFLETKVKESNIQHVMSKVCLNWKWEHNATSTERGRIIPSWHPRKYHFNLILKSDQLIHGQVMHLPTTKHFFLTLVYGRNLDDQRIPLWETIESIALNMDEPWCVLGDFNTVLRIGERIGDVEVTERETRDYASCINHSGLIEFQYEGAFFTWTNKSVWSRIDSAFHNDFWFNCNDYTHVMYRSQGLFDHNLIILSFPQCPKPISSFQFCEMWTKDRSYNKEDYRVTEGYKWLIDDNVNPNGPIWSGQELAYQDTHLQCGFLCKIDFQYCRD